MTDDNDGKGASFSNLWPVLLAALIALAVVWFATKAIPQAAYDAVNHERSE